MSLWSRLFRTSNICEATGSGDLERVKALLRRHPDRVHSEDDKRYTPLHNAALYGHKAVVEVLLANGAYVKASTGLVPWQGSTPLELAAGRGHVNVVELLRRHGGDDGTFRPAPKPPSLRNINESRGDVCLSMAQPRPRGPFG